MANGKPGLVSRLRHKASEVVLGLGCLGFFGGFLGVPAGLAADEVFHAYDVGETIGAASALTCGGGFALMILSDCFIPAARRRRLDEEGAEKPAAAATQPAPAGPGKFNL